MRLVLLLVTLLTLSTIASAQNLAAKPEENARLKPLVAEFTKAQEALNAKLVQSPEAKAVNDAKAAYDKAVAALDEARKKLPEFQTALAAEAKVLDEMYKILASHSLSSREFRPVLNEKSELAFVKTEQPPRP